MMRTGSEMTDCSFGNDFAFAAATPGGDLERKKDILILILYLQELLLPRSQPTVSYLPTV